MRGTQQASVSLSIFSFARLASTFAHNVRCRLLSIPQAGTSAWLRGTQQASVSLSIFSFARLASTFAHNKGRIGQDTMLDEPRPPLQAHQKLAVHCHSLANVHLLLGLFVLVWSVVGLAKRGMACPCVVPLVGGLGGYAVQLLDTDLPLGVENFHHHRDRRAHNTASYNDTFLTTAVSVGAVVVASLQKRANSFFNVHHTHTSSSSRFPFSSSLKLGISSRVMYP